MHTVLLTGAGFSRNWGGWLASEAFEYLLGCPQVAANPACRRLLWKHLDSGGFENALAEIQTDFARDPGAFGDQLRVLQSAVESMFRDMNEAFKFTIGGTPFMQEVARFLYRFDAIFTLNQDLLVEMLFFDEAKQATHKWENMVLPGMERIGEDDGNLKSWATGHWVPRPWSVGQVNPRLLPYYKLHGGSIWRAADSPLMVMGGDKAAAIRLFPILSAYKTAFHESLHQPDTRLMVIGYGFRDGHINDELIAAAKQGLRLFIIDPQGAEVARRLNPTRRPGVPVFGGNTPLEDAVEASLIGASRRDLRTIFGDSRLEREKVLRFFS